MKTDQWKRKKLWRFWRRECRHQVHVTSSRGNFLWWQIKKIQKLSKVTPYTGCAAGAPVVIVPVYHTEGLVAPSFAQIDMAIAQQNIWLETDALGLGGVWFGIAPMEDRMEEIHSLLELPENVKVFSMFALGYPAETRPQQNRFAPERIHFIEK